MLLLAYAIVVILVIFPVPFSLFTLPFVRLGIGVLGMIIGLTIAWTLIALGWQATIGRPMPVLAFAIALFITNSIDILAQQTGRPRSLIVGAQMWAIITVGIVTFFHSSKAGWLS